jgi:cold-inducible RNA-binding protein
MPPTIDEWPSRSQKNRIFTNKNHATARKPASRWNDFIRVKYTKGPREKPTFIRKSALKLKSVVVLTAAIKVYYSDLRGEPFAGKTRIFHVHHFHFNQRSVLMGKRLYVGNLSYSLRDDDLQQLFATSGTVVSAQVIMDRSIGRSKGFGFVEMTSDEEAQAAITAFNGKEVEGRALTVNEARPKVEGMSRGRNAYN